MFLLRTVGFISQFVVVGEIPINEKLFGAQITSAACYIMVHHGEGICVQRSTCVLFSTKRRENFPISQKSTPKIFWWGRTRSTHYTKAKIMIQNWHHWHFHICTVLHLIECKLKYVKKNLWKYASLNFCCCLMFLRVFLGYF